MSTHEGKEPTVAAERTATGCGVTGLCGHAAPEGDGVRPGAEGFHAAFLAAPRPHMRERVRHERRGHALPPECRMHQEPGERKPSAAHAACLDHEGQPDGIGLRASRRTPGEEPDAGPPVPTRQLRPETRRRQPRPRPRVGVTGQEQHPHHVEAEAVIQWKNCPFPRLAAGEARCFRIKNMTDHSHDTVVNLPARDRKAI